MNTRTEAQHLLEAQRLLEQTATKHQLSDQAYAEIVGLLVDQMKHRQANGRVQVRFHKPSGYYWVTLDGYCYAQSASADTAVRDAIALLSLLDRGVKVEINTALKYEKEAA